MLKHLISILMASRTLNIKLLLKALVDLFNQPVNGPRACGTKVSIEIGCSILAFSSLAAAMYLPPIGSPLS